ncbi:hypothetical protein FRC12_011286 [Ceratobasidium sp. 428]|nr:hypothetical protein FRC12_011286 [Ceratobasidium sp. 428]
MSRARASLSPRTGIQFEGLPDTIISDIFVLVWCSRDHEIWRDIHKMRIPYILASVSRRWREIALSTSRIWTFVDISLRSKYLSTHLARSKNLPIDVDLVQDTKRFHQNDLQKRLDILEWTNSWARMIDLSALCNYQDMDMFVHAFSNAIDDSPTNILQSIRIDTLSVLQTAISITLPRHTAVSHMNMSRIRQLPSRPLPRLRRFQLKNIEFDLSRTLIPFLCLTPNLTDLSLEACRSPNRFQNVATPVPEHSILLAELDTLTLSGVEEKSGMIVLFRALDMPKLRHLFLTFGVHSRRQRNLLDWSAICYNRAIQTLELDGLSSGALAGLIPCIDQLEQLSALLLSNRSLDAPRDDYYWYTSSRTTGPDRFVGQFARRLLETACCQSLTTLGIYFPLGDESREAVKALERTRPWMSIHIAYNDGLILHGSGEVNEFEYFDDVWPELPVDT